MLKVSKAFDKYQLCRELGSISRPTDYEKSVLTSRPEGCAIILVNPPRVFAVTMLNLKKDLKQIGENREGGEDGKLVSYGIRPNFEYSMSHSDLSKRMGSPYSHYRKQIFSGLNITIKVLYPKHSFFTSN